MLGDPAQCHTWSGDSLAVFLNSVNRSCRRSATAVSSSAAATLHPPTLIFVLHPSLSFSTLSSSAQACASWPEARTALAAQAPAEDAEGGVTRRCERSTTKSVNHINHQHKKPKQNKTHMNPSNNTFRRLRRPRLRRLQSHRRSGRRPPRPPGLLGRAPPDEGASSRSCASAGK